VSKKSFPFKTTMGGRMSPAAETHITSVRDALVVFKLDTQCFESLAVNTTSLPLKKQNKMERMRELYGYLIYIRKKSLEITDNYCNFSFITADQIYLDFFGRHNLLLIISIFNTGIDSCCGTHFSQWSAVSSMLIMQSPSKGP